MLNGCSSLSDELVSRFSRVLFNLQELDLSSCLHVTDIGLSAITDFLVNLRLLRLSWCINITDNGLIGIAVQANSSQRQKHTHGVKREDNKKARPKSDTVTTSKTKQRITGFSKFH